MNLECDFLVIGGGMAGLVSGITTSKDGFSTVLLRKGQSATAYSSGAIDVIGYLPNAVEPFSSPEEGLTAVAGLLPLHPYSVIGYRDDVQPDNVVDEIVGQTRDAINWLKTHLKDTIAPLKGTFDSNIHPITVLGTTKPTCLVQETMYSDTLEQREDTVLLFVGFTGFPDFNPSIAAKTFLEDRLAIGTPPRKVGWCELRVTPFGKPYNLSSIELARHLDHENSMEDLAGPLKKQVEQIGATHVAIPPILGVKRALENKKSLEERLGVEIFELLGFPPSVPGLRLQIALEGVFRNSGGNLLVGHEAISCIKINDRVTSITAKAPRRMIQINPKAVILASGKFIGGGLQGDENGIRESVFDLMTVTGAYHSAGDILPSRFTNRVAISPEGQPVYSCGLTVDPLFRPIQEDGVEWASNLFTAGSVLAGYDYSVEKSGLGVAATSGYSAAKSAISYLKDVV
ncbi:MAG: anaerobic glycerol-3-phosphate dehydrogenase subunit GlpB [Candidatus Thorarchaeota archaeon]|jgi:glycerol-3-phosphate dehydrogenase subunit B